MKVAENYDLQIKEKKNKMNKELSFISQFYETRQEQIFEKYYDSQSENWQ